MARKRDRRGARVSPARSSETPEPAPALFPRLPFGIAAVIVLLAAVLPFLNTLGNGFVYDDHALIEHDPRVREHQPLTEAFRGDMWREPGPGSKAYRPLFTLSLMINHRLAGLHVWAWHLVNVLLHAAACLLLFILARERVPPGAALAGAVLFALHPIHTEAVSWITGRSELMMTIFVLAALWAGTRKAQGARRWRWALASLGLMVLALLSKETAIVAPLLLLCVLACRGAGRIPRDGWLAPGLLLGAAALYLVARAAATGGIGAAPEGQVLAEYGLGSRILLAGSLVWKYLALLLYPVNLTVEYFVPKYPPEFHWTALIGPAGVLALLGLAILLRRRFPGGGLAAGWTLIALLPVLNLIPIGAAQAERFLYLPSAAFCILLGAALAGPWFANAFRWGFLVCLCLFYVTVTIVRNADWKSDETLWAAAARVADTPLALRNHGDHLLVEGKTREALDAYRRARDTEPDNWEHYYRIGLANAQLGQFAEAVDAHRRALAFGNAGPGVSFNLGNALRDGGQPDAALEAYQRALDENPNDAGARYNLAHLLNTLGRFADAEAAYRQLLTDHPDHLSGRHNLANLLTRTGRTGEGVMEFREVLRRDPVRVVTWQALSNALWDAGDRTGAVEALQEIQRIRPDAGVQSDLGYALFRMNAFDQARDNYRAALRADPAHVKTLRRMAALCAAEGQIDDGLTYLERLMATKRVRALDLMEDPELAALTRHPRFLAIAGLGQNRNAEGFAAPTPVR